MHNKRLQNFESLFNFTELYKFWILVSITVFWQTKSLISQSSVNQRNLLYWFHKLLGTRKITPCSHRCTGSETSLASPNFFLGLLYTQTYPASILLILDKGKMGHPLTLAYNSKKCYQSITNSPLYVTCSTFLHFYLFSLIQLC